jgi:hypothetical protein
MSRSIHKTVAQVARDNSRQEIAHPDNQDVADLARKTGYKKSERRKRHDVVTITVQDDGAVPNNSFKPNPHQVP